MTSPRYAQLASKLLADAGDAAPRPPPSPDARLRAVAAIEQAIVARARQRRRARWIGRVAAAAAVVVCGLGVAKLVVDLRAPSPVAAPAVPGVSSSLLAFTPVLHSTGGVVVAGAGDTFTPLPDGAPVARGKRLVARPLGHATLAFATGTELTLEERSDITIDEGGASQRFSLAAGAVNAHVAKLAPGQRFVIATPDAEVEVHGTTFRVAVVPADPSCGGGATTRVDVLEGVVVVRSRGAETSVGAGERWPTGCAQTASNTFTPPVIAAVDPKKPAPATSATPSSQLSEQNDMFAEAVAAKRRGATGQALVGFERFLAKYPGSPLAESAMAERMRLLRGGDRARAQAAAKQYLARFPGGFARGDAQAILADGQ